MTSNGIPVPGSNGELVFPMPWENYELPLRQSGADPKEVDIEYSGQTKIKAVYGPDPDYNAFPDPNDGIGHSELVHGSNGWHLYGGYVYLTGHWNYIESLRTRTVTWGTGVVARIAPPFSGSGMLAARDQVFVLDGDVYIFPKNGTAAAPIAVSTGQYIYATGTAPNIVIHGPYSIPTSTTPPPVDAEQIYNFLAAVQAALPNP
ncbi:MAG: hypothetical protein HND58_18005 [Planctomycetota bacterium]|nr:MAG: hypothetical protein HND58_18005 [Planctomycetota bacterium]